MITVNSLLIVNAAEQSGGPSYLSNKRLIKSERESERERERRRKGRGEKDF